MHSLTNSPDSNRRASETGYDRRVRRQVYDYDSEGQPPGWTVLVSDTKFLFDGWNVLEETNGMSSDAIIRKYTWGLDLSGQNGRPDASGIQRAGGIGGLLAMHNQSPSKDFLYFYDGNGNVGQMIDLSDGSIDGKYEYYPFGGELASGGSYYSLNPFRFSTKYIDLETRTYYYGYRHHFPKHGRWMSRDPIEEDDTWNLYQFVRNDSSNSTDMLGMWEIDEDKPGHYKWTLDIGTPIVGESCAKAIAYWNVQTDLGRKRPFFGDVRYHFDAHPILGTYMPGARDQARAIERQRIANGLITMTCPMIQEGIGHIMHIEQDVFAHQAGGRATDGSGGHDAQTPGQHIGLVAGTLIANPFSPNFGIANWGRPDRADLFPDDVEKAKRVTTALFNAFKEILERKPCCCQRQ